MFVSSTKIIVTIAVGRPTASSSHTQKRCRPSCPFHGHCRRMGPSAIVIGTDTENGLYRTSRQTTMPTVADSESSGPSGERGRHFRHSHTRCPHQPKMVLPIVTLVMTVRPDHHHCHRRRQHSQQGTDPFCPMWLVVVCRSIGRSVGSLHSFLCRYRG